MRANRPKRAALNRAADKWRKAQCQRLSRCEFCGKRRPFNLLLVHELLKGALRALAFDKPFATLVVCALYCHEKVDREPVERQLARLYLSRQSEYDLAAFWKLRGRRLPEQEAVDEHIDDLLGGVPAIR